MRLVRSLGLCISMGPDSGLLERLSSLSALAREVKAASSMLVIAVALLTESHSSLAISRVSHPDGRTAAMTSLG